MMDRPFPLQPQWIGLTPRRRPENGWRWRRLWFALVPAAAVVAIYAVTRPAAKPVIATVPIENVESFDSRYVKTPLPVTNLVRTIPISPTPVPQPPPPQPQTPEVAVADDLPPPPVRVRKTRAAPRETRDKSDVCQKHGMRKVMTGKYKWRCRK